jgi:phage FluMu protein gp41
MAITTAYTLAEAKEMLTLWKECEKALASGQAKEYRVGTREFTAVDLPDIAARINYFGNVVEALSGGVRTKRVVRVVPRDM